MALASPPSKYGLGYLGGGTKLRRRKPGRETKRERRRGRAGKVGRTLEGLVPTTGASPVLTHTSNPCALTLGTWQLWAQGHPRHCPAGSGQAASLLFIPNTPDAQAMRGRRNIQLSCGAYCLQLRDIGPVMPRVRPKQQQTSSGAPALTPTPHAWHLVEAQDTVDPGLALPAAPEMCRTDNLSIDPDPRRKLILSLLRSHISSSARR